MNKVTTPEYIESIDFASIEDFRECIECGGEVVFVWKDRTYGAYSKLQRTPTSPIQKLICEVEIDDIESTEKWCDTADEVLEYMVGSDMLRDVITKVTVLERTR